jgi:hypothetical protein
MVSRRSGAAALLFPTERTPKVVPSEGSAVLLGPLTIIRPLAGEAKLRVLCFFKANSQAADTWSRWNSEPSPDHGEGLAQTLWARPDQSVAASHDRLNPLSPCLTKKLGGLGFTIGAGKLRNPGAERNPGRCSDAALHLT